MNTTNISGWRACAGTFSPLRLCILSAVLLATCGASAQMGNNNNNPGPGQTNPTPVTPATNTSAPATQSTFVPGPAAMPKPAFTVNSVRDVIALQARSAPGTGALLPWPPTQDFASKTFVSADALHALKHTPIPLARVSSKRAGKTAPPGLWDFPLSGPRAKLAPISPPKTQPEKKPEPLNPQP